MLFSDLKSDCDICVFKLAAIIMYRPVLLTINYDKKINNP